MSRLPAALVALALLAPATSRADIYQFTDKDGVIHFTSTPPGGVGARLVVRGGGNGSGVRPGVVPYMPQDRDVGRFTRYDDWIHQAATLYQIPEALVRAVIKVESDYDPRAVSVSGARGLMQLMPDTATSLSVKDIDDPRENIFGGVRLLRILANTFNGDLDLTVAAYNAGPDSVMKYGGIPPYQQTRDYVVKVTGYYRRFRSTPDVAAAALGAL